MDKKQTKVQAVKDLLTDKPRPTALEKWFSTHTEQEATLYLIWHHMTGKSILNGDDPSEIMSFFREDILYEHNPPWIFRDPPEKILHNLCSKKTKLLVYFEQENECVYYDKNTDTTLIINDFKQIPL